MVVSKEKPVKAEPIAPLGAAIVGVGLVLGLTLMLIKPFPGLHPEGMRALAIMVFTISLWISRIMDEYIVGLIMIVGWVVLQVVPLETALATFASPAWWLIVAAMGLGAAAGESGLLHRISLHMLARLPNSVIGQSVGLALAGTLVGPALPSALAKTAVAGQFVGELADAANLDDKGRAACFIGMHAGAAMACPLFLTGSLTSFVLIGALEAQGIASPTWWGWTVRAIWLVLPVLVISLGAALWPVRGRRISTGGREYIRRQIRELGPLSRKEWVTTIVLASTVLLWALEPWHGVAVTTVAIAGLVALLVLGALDKEGLQRGLSWPFLIFVGSVLNLAVVLPRVGIDKWMTEIIAPSLAAIAAKPSLFVGALVVAMTLLRLVFVSYNTLVGLFTLMVTPIALKFNYDPWAIGLVFYLAGQGVWFSSYQNIPYTVGNAASGQMISPKETRRWSWIYLIAVLIVSVVVFPFWGRG